MIIDESMDENNMNHLCSKEYCTGCGACVYTCLHGAVSLYEDVLGFSYPSIDSQKCVNCGLCDMACPSLNELIKNKIQKVFIGWRKDIVDNTNCASGGIASLLIRNTINNNGEAFACMFDSGSLRFVQIKSNEQITKTQGSKYVQASTNGLISNIKELLLMGKRVLVIGTPCLIAGIRKAIKINLDNLFLVDIICHGVASQKLLFEHLNDCGIMMSEIANISFRNQNGYYLNVIGKNGETLLNRDCFQDLFFSGYNDSLFVRESCVNCQYATDSRVGDVTIGDFHKYQHMIIPSGDVIDYPSMILLNTLKGNVLFDGIQNDIVSEEKTLQDAKESNPHLLRPTTRRGNYNEFVRLYGKYGFRIAAKKALRVRRMKNILIRASKNLVTYKR